MMTSLDENAEQLTGFNAGADDYVVKPVDPLLLLARIRSLLRRHPQAPRAFYQWHSFRLELNSHFAWLDEQPLQFSVAEFELLAIFARHSGVLLTREKLLQSLRGLEYDGLNRSVDMRVSRLRKKLMSLACPVTIQTITAQGYLFVEIPQGGRHVE